jgi:anti-anti-sigma regulatory factor
MTGPTIQVELEGDFDIAAAGKLKEELSDTMKFGREVCVSLARASALGINAVQLLWAAAHEARMAGRRFSFVRPVPEHIIVSLQEAGIPFASLLEGES